MAPRNRYKGTQATGASELGETSPLYSVYVLAIVGVIAISGTRSVVSFLKRRYLPYGNSLIGKSEY